MGHGDRRVEDAPRAWRRSAASRRSPLSRAARGAPQLARDSVLSLAPSRSLDTARIAQFQHEPVVLGVRRGTRAPRRRRTNRRRGPLARAGLAGALTRADA